MAKDKVRLDEVIFKEITKSETQKLRIWRNTYKGRTFNSLQQMWRQTPVDEWQFGKGVTFHEEDIDNIVAGLLAMQVWYEENA